MPAIAHHANHLQRFPDLVLTREHRRRTVCETADVAGGQRPHSPFPLPPLSPAPCRSRVPVWGMKELAERWRVRVQREEGIASGGRDGADDDDDDDVASDDDSDDDDVTGDDDDNDDDDDDDDGDGDDDGATSPCHATHAPRGSPPRRTKLGSKRRRLEESVHCQPRNRERRSRASPQCHPTCSCITACAPEVLASQGGCSRMDSVD